MGAIFLGFGSSIVAALSSRSGMGLLFAVLFVVILGSALAVVRHAEHLSELIGDPYGSLILTVSVAFIEVVSISAVVMHGDSNPTLVRDSLLSVVMIVLNGMVGASLLIGAWRHREQVYNLQGANAYLGVIIPMVVLALVMPTFTVTTPEPTLSRDQAIFLSVMSVGLYGAFLAIQTGRHRGYFVEQREEPLARGQSGDSNPVELKAMMPAWTVSAGPIPAETASGLWGGAAATTTLPRFRSASRTRARSSMQPLTMAKGAMARTMPAVAVVAAAMAKVVAARGISTAMGQKTAIRVVVVAARASPSRRRRPARRRPNRSPLTRVAARALPRSSSISAGASSRRESSNARVPTNSLRLC